VPRISKKELIAAANAALTSPEQLPNKYDLAKYFNVTLRTIDRWVKERRIPSIQMGSRCTRFEWPAVKKAVARHLVEEVK
jgi:excisionase family DNA binding protein